MKTNEKTKVTITLNTEDAKNFMPTVLGGFIKPANWDDIQPGTDAIILFGHENNRELNLKERAARMKRFISSLTTIAYRIQREGGLTK